MGPHHTWIRQENKRKKHFYRRSITWGKGFGKLRSSQDLEKMYFRAFLNESKLLVSLLLNLDSSVDGIY